MAFPSRVLVCLLPLVALSTGCDRGESETAAGAEPETGAESATESESETESGSGAVPESESGPVPAADSPLIQRAIEAHGGEVLRRATVEFDFRGDHFRVWRNGGRYRYERTMETDRGSVRDALSNDGLERFVDGEPVELDDSETKGLTSSVDSVVYFALLPLFLGDPGVLAEPLDDVEVDGTTYARVRITFEGEGQHQDVYLYWFERGSLHMDYLAYKYRTGGGGVRFREAMNRREVGGVTFADYENYGLPEDHPKADDPMSLDLTTLFDLHLAGELRHVSTVAIDDVSVEPHDEQG